MTFKEQLLGSLLTFQRGYDITKAEQTEGDVPIVSSSGVSSFHNESKAIAPGVVIGRKGTLGTVHYLDSPYWPHDTTLWIKDFRGSHPRFLSYFLSTLQLQNFDTGASNPTLNRNHLHKIKVIAPSRKEQEAIAAILAVYDDLIANNQRRIVLLESMAEEIYREWFVRMRFPGYETATYKRGMPLGWTHEPILDAFQFYGGATPSKDNPRFWNDGEVHWYTPTDITRASSPYLEESADKCTDEGQQNCSANLFPAHSIMVTSRATIGAIGINCAPACTNQGFITCIPNQRYPLTYLYHWLKLAKPHFEMLSGGATFAELTKGSFKRIRILTPPEKLVIAYEKQARPMFDQVESLTKANRRLRATRDALLPRLISGKLRVDGLDIKFPPSMQKLHEEAP